MVDQIIFRKKIAGIPVDFIAIIETNNKTNEQKEVGIYLEFPYIEQRRHSCEFSEKKSIEIVTITPNSYHDKQKKFTESYFLKFINKFLNRVKKYELVCEELISPNTECFRHIINHLYQLDYLLQKSTIEQIDSIKGLDFKKFDGIVTVIRGE